MPVEPTFRPFDPDRDEAALVDLLTTETWPHRVKVQMTAADVREELARDAYAGDGVLTELIELDGEVVGLVRAEDLGAERTDPQLDFRVREAMRGQGIGLAALRHITTVIFSRYPGTLRIEAQTRQDNHAMRTVLLRGGYVQEAVYRRGWPATGADVYDGIGYAILRSDWESGTTTPVEW